ncbi:hypothetical protein [Deinococcus radiotolerans]|uniref:XRE family transcriptional regulator n=1 Tax=Deinococcus radiotolerans TaxID=1309407 RepID=A0ABQ2FR14_9DEIO|nr:hypothetical protein [Deinococcus radiotolerans]GGL18510.1 hypothetical protein GCM10010844_41680 [Deinococcus radiotolerans]
MIRFSLDHYLRDHGLTAYRLVKETEGKVARGSIFAMARGDSVKRIDLENLNHVVAALSALTGEKVSVADLFTGEPEPVSLRTTGAGVPYTDDEETNAVLDDHPDILDRLKRRRERQGAP